MVTITLGVRYALGEYAKGDTPELRAGLREREGVVPAENISNVKFIVQGPNGILIGYPTSLKTTTGVIYKPEPNVPTTKGYEITGIPSTTGIVANKTLVRGKNIKPGAVVNKVVSSTAVTMDYESLIVEPKVNEETISLEFENIEWPGTIESDGQGYLKWTNTEETGQYLVKAQFTLTTGEIRSVMVNFSVEDPFNVPPPTLTTLVAEEAWLRLSDCFDSTEGGPVLRDFTLAHFDLSKIEKFVPDALLDINVQMPPSEHSVSVFAQPLGNGETNPLMPLLSKGVLCKTLQHLIRSYNEQPVPQGAQIAYEDRTRYSQAWQQSYQIEHEDWYTMVRLWKRQELNLGHSALLVSSKAGRMYYNGNLLAAQGIQRGFY